VRGITTASPYKGQGIGQALYDKAIAESKQRGYRNFYSDSSNAMTPDAHKAWERLKSRHKIEMEEGEDGYDSSSRRKINLTAKILTIRAYHGTTSGGFDTFKPNVRKGEQLGFGIHFAADKSIAESYAYDEATRRRGKAPMVYTVDLTINNPLQAQQLILEGTPEFALARKLAGPRLMTDKNEHGVKCSWMQNAIDASSPQRAEKLIREAGYDGVIYQAVIGGSVNPHSRTRNISAKGEVYLVFDPSQIKIVSTDTEPTPPRSRAAKLLTRIASDPQVLENAAWQAREDAMSGGYAVGGECQVVSERVIDILEAQGIHADLKNA
jgi:hypothetical protein